jgi:hypothetical protein
VLVLAVVLAACGNDRVSEVIVIADTDMIVPDEVDTIRMAVTDSGGLRQEAVSDLGASAPRPAMLGLVSRDGTSTFFVVVTGERGGVEVVRRTARVTASRGRMVALRMDLWRRCVAATCGADETCGDDGCRATTIAAAELVDWRGAPPPTTDAGIPIDDAALDPADAAYDDASAPTDDATAAEDDASGPPPDAGPPPECTTAAECSDAWTCTADDCTDGHCTHVASDAACADGVSCTAERCDLALGCVYAVDDAACDDGVACTHDTCDRLAGCQSAPRPSSCASGSYCDATMGCTAAPRFAELYTSIITARCAPCHVTTSPRAGGLDMATAPIAYASLVGVTATCGGGANTRVIAGDATHSLLYRKVAGVDLCGVRMPRLLTPLDDAQIAQIERWIVAGALE